MSKDLFSSHAKEYAQFRPQYSRVLYDFVFDVTKAKRSAWDAGTGNGQVAQVLASHFDHVYATDISAAQLAQTVSQKNITYQVANEEVPFIATGSIDLITVAQAIHWFNRSKFYGEAKRVLQPDGVIAAWGYGLIDVNEAVNRHLQVFYRDVLGAYWDIDRQHIDDAYQNISFPFQEITSPKFFMTFEWTKDQLFGYLNTWSAVKSYIKLNKENPTDNLQEQISPLLRDAFTVQFPIFMRVGTL